MLLSILGNPQVSNDEDNVLLTALANSSNVSPIIIIDQSRGKFSVVFNGNLLKQTKVAYNLGRIVNIYITYKLQKRNNDNPDMTLESSLFGTVKIIKIAATIK